MENKQNHKDQRRELIGKRDSGKVGKTLNFGLLTSVFEQQPWQDVAILKNQQSKQGLMRGAVMVALEEL